MLCSPNDHHYYSFFFFILFFFFVKFLFCFQFSFSCLSFFVCDAFFHEMKKKRKENDNISSVNKIQNHVFLWQALFFSVSNLLNSGNFVDFFFSSDSFVHFFFCVGWLGYYTHVCAQFYHSFSIFCFFRSRSGVCRLFIFNILVSQRDTKYFFDILRIQESRRQKKKNNIED